MPAIALERKHVAARIRNPLKNFQITEETIEIRTDPLLGTTSRIVSPKGLDAAPGDNPLQVYVRQSESCFFCKGRVENQTPMLPQEVYEPGRIQMGDAMLFPNLSGYGKYSGVCIFSKDHFIHLNAFGKTLVLNALKACQTYLRICAEFDEDMLYPTLNWNYLLPAGSSLLHPHLQPILDPVPTNVHRWIMESGHGYWLKNGTVFWEDLKRAERGGPRFLWETDHAFWLTPFAPTAINEINAVVGKGESFLDLNENALAELAIGIVDILRFFHHLKRNSFNMALFSAPVNEKKKGDAPLPCLLKIGTRSAFSPLYRSDTTFFERFHQESILEQTPEQVADTYKAFSCNSL